MDAPPTRTELLEAAGAATAEQGTIGPDSTPRPVATAAAVVVIDDDDDDDVDDDGDDDGSDADYAPSSGARRHWRGWRAWPGEHPAVLARPSR